MCASAPSPTLTRPRNGPAAVSIASAQRALSQIGKGANPLGFVSNTLDKGKNFVDNTVGAGKAAIDSLHNKPIPVPPTPLPIINSAAYWVPPPTTLEPQYVAPVVVQSGPSAVSLGVRV